MRKQKACLSIFTSALTLLALLSAAQPAAAEERPTRPGAAARKGSSAEPARSGVVNLNTASERELTALPGIGPAKAEAIVAMRTRLKRFSKLEQLMRVRGIGRKTFRRLRPMLTLSGPTTLAKAAKPAAANAAKPSAAGATKPTKR